MFENLKDPSGAMLKVECLVYNPGNDPRGKLAITVHTEGKNSAAFMWWYSGGVWTKLVQKIVFYGKKANPTMLQMALEEYTSKHASALWGDTDLKAAVDELQKQITLLLEKNKS